MNLNSLEQIIFIKGYNFLYQPLWNWTPVDMSIEKNTKEDFDSLRERFKNRINLILPEVNSSGTFIDMGCNIGWNSFEIYDKGGTVVGVDNSYRDIHFIPITEYLIDYHKLDRNRISFVDSRIQEYFDENKTIYDYCICLLLIHHYLWEGYGPASNHKRIIESHTDKFFTEDGRRLMDTIYQRCNIAAFLQLRFHVDKELDGKPYELFVDYLINEIGFSDVKVLSSDDVIYGEEAVIYKCIK